ncbi:MAG: alpha/beta hydrolase [Ruminococcaceae bacterium]|nr:alpha/beta hydrolase [Oscillospiraceae bacterium]
MKLETIKLKEIYPFLSENGCDPTLTVYLPYNDYPEIKKDSRPCMLVIPGGGYASCSNREAEPFALRFAALGFNAFVLKYSCAENRFPTQLIEVAAAMDLIHKNTEKWDCDTNKIAIIGFSAGGHLSAHYSTSFDMPEIRERFPESYPVNATILCYPVITADPEHAHKGSFLNLLGSYPETAEELDKYSCNKLVNEKTPPAFIWHTTTDQAVPVQNSLLYADALSKCGIPYELHIYPYGQHGLATADRVTCPPLDKNLKLTADWLVALKKWLDVTLDLDE